MLRRAGMGMAKGAIAGALPAALLVYGLGLTAFGGLWVALPAALAAGLLAGIVAGRPPWASGARVETALKAVAGALLSVGLMLLLRRYVTFELTLPGELGAGAVGELPLVALPLLGALLGLLFELDHTGDAKAAESAPRRVGKGAAGTRVAPTPDPEVAELESPPSDGTVRRRRR